VGPRRSSTRIALCFPLLLSVVTGFEIENLEEGAAWFRDVIFGEGKRFEVKLGEAKLGEVKLGEVKLGDGTWFGPEKFGEEA
jgi:hypothetical protein